MKIFIRILLFISLAANGYFIYDEIRISNNKARAEIFARAFSGGVINKTTWQKGFESFITKLKQKNKILAEKKYFYINTWATFCCY